MSEAKFACEVDPKINDVCKNPFINQYLQRRQLNEKQMNLFAYQQLSAAASVNNSQLPHDRTAELYKPDLIK